jgi:UDP-glucose 4-epimerase
MRRALVTGVAGFMGSHIADALLKNDWEVVGIDNLIGGYRDNVPKEVFFVDADLADLDAISPHFKNVEVVVHAACTAYEGLSVFSPALVVQNTAQITATVMSASVSAQVKKVVFLSSMARYGTQESVPFTEEMTPKPQDPYGIAKVCAENLVSNIATTHGLDFVILVPHNIIGPRQKYDDPFRNVASIMINRMLKGEQPIIYGDGNQRRCFSFMTDVVDPVVKAVEADSANGLIVNIGPDEEFISINHLAIKIAHILDFDLAPIYVPGRPQEVEQANCSADKARQILGYQTTVSLDEGLRELIAWIRTRGTREFEYHLPLEIVNSKTPRTWTEKLI